MTSSMSAWSISWSITYCTQRLPCSLFKLSVEVFCLLWRNKEISATDSKDFLIPVLLGIILCMLTCLLYTTSEPQQVAMCLPDQVTKTIIQKWITPQTMVSIQNVNLLWHSNNIKSRKALKSSFLNPIKSLLPLQLYEIWFLHNETSFKKVLY